MNIGYLAATLSQYHSHSNKNLRDEFKSLFPQSSCWCSTYISVNDWCTIFSIPFLNHFWKMEFKPFGEGNPFSLYCKQKTDTKTPIALSSPIGKEMEDQEDWYYLQSVPCSSKWKIYSNSKWEKGKFLLLPNEVAHYKKTVGDILEKKYLHKSNKIFPKDWANLGNIN